MRTQEEIVQRIKDIEDDDLFGFQTGDLIEYLDYEYAKPFLKDEITEEKWKSIRKLAETPKEQMINYMEFAWQKANDKRGLSAGRTMEHYTAWLWLDGDDEIWPTLDKYEFYGKLHLIRICHYLGLDPTKWDDGVRENF